MEPIEKQEIPNELLEFLGDIKNIIFPRQGYTSDVGIVESKRGIYALKRTKGDRFCEWLHREVKVMNCLAKTNLPIPKVYKFIEEKDMNQSWGLYEYVEGNTLRSELLDEKNEEKRQELIYNFGKVLHDIHSTSCPIELRDEATPWIDKMISKAEFNLNNYETEGTNELINNLKVNKPLYCEQKLIHGDFTIDNVLVNNGRISGIIDWSGGAFGDARYDVSLAIRPKSNAFQIKEDIDIFFEGYGKRIINEEEFNFFKSLYDFF